MSATPLALGPFDLTARVGRGGMGEIWRGRHRRSGLDVAIKVLPSGAEDLVRLASALRREIEAAAGLRHPHVIEVLDAGNVPAGARDASDGLLVPGSPWLAMEWASGGHLGERLVPPAALLEVLEQLLDALAHAHARGTLHLDLKPANVLLRDPGSWRIALADFGVAHAYRRHARDPSPLGGTPRFMPPEQRQGRWHDLGPWTDLFAVGRLALELIGEAGASWPGLLGWARWLTAVDPRDRPALAADARHALQALPPPPPDATAGPPPARPSPSPGAWSTVDMDPVEGGEHPPLADAEPAAPAIRPTRAPVAESWRDRPMARTREIEDAGLGLLAVRRVAFAGRFAERDLLWAALREVVATGQPRLCLVRGGSGSGRSRLAEWLAEQAEETGSAVAHRLGSDPAELFPVGGLAASPSADLLRRRLAACLPSGDPNLVELAAELVRGRIDDPEERALVVARTLRGWARERPRVVLLGPIEQVAHRRTLLRHLLRAPVGTAAPLLILATAPDPLPPRQDRAPWRRGATHVVLPPTSDQELAEMLRGTLGLEPRLRTRIVQAAGGNPRFAEELLRTLVAREQIEPGPEGFRLAAGATLELPADAAEAVAARLEAALRGAAPPVVEAAEIAAALALRPDPRDFEAACRRAGADPLEVSERLGRAGLLRARTGGPGFSDVLVRQQILSRAERAGVRAARHRSAAAILAERSADPGEVGEQLAEAGDEAAVPALIAALDGAEARRDLGRRAALCAALQRITEDLPPEDPRRGASLLRRAQHALADWDFARAERLAEELRHEATRWGWPELRVEALLPLARVLHFTGDGARALPLLREAVAAARRLDDTDLLARSLTHLARALKRAGDLAGAEAVYRDVLALAEGLEPRPLWVEEELAHLVATLGRHEEALALVEELAAHLEGRDDPDRDAGCQLLRAEVQRMRGDPAGAEVTLRALLESLPRAFEGRAGLARANLGLALLEQGRWREARERLHASLGWTHLRGLRFFEAALQAALAVAAAGLRDAEGCRSHLDACADIVAAGGVRDHEILALLERLASAATEAGWEELTARTTRLAERVRPQEDASPPP